MLCLRNGCGGQTKIIDSRLRPDGTYYRRRECLTCSQRYRTSERIVAVQNGGGQYEPYRQPVGPSGEFLPTNQVKALIRRETAALGTNLRAGVDELRGKKTARVHRPS